MAPFSAAKTTSYSAILFSGMFGYYLARYFVTRTIGDDEEAGRLMVHRSAILAGEMAL